MPHQFLHHLHFRARCMEKCRVGSAKCVPANPLCYAQPLRCGADVVSKKLLSPIWGFSSFLGTGEHPTLRRSKWCSAVSCINRMIHVYTCIPKGIRDKWTE